MVDGENGFFSVNEQYRRGLPYLISSMPKARLVKAKNNHNLNKFSREDQLILMKSSGVWNRNDTENILPRPDNLLSYWLLNSIMSNEWLNEILYEIFKLSEDCFVWRHKGKISYNWYDWSFCYFNSEGLPNAKILLIVKDPIGETQL